jgi:hypothetical protein
MCLREKKEEHEEFLKACVDAEEVEVWIRKV